MAPPFEPEETFGQYWHRWVGQAASWPHHPAAAVRLEEVRNRLGVMFRALGGDHGARLLAAGAQASGHRLSLRQRLGLGAAERMEAARFDGALLELPATLDLLPDRAGNEALYEWLAAWFAAAPPPQAPPADPLQADLARLRFAAAHTQALLQRWPGLRPLHGRLAAQLLALRPSRRLPAREAEVEQAVRALLAGSPAEPRLPAVAHAPAGYRPFLPVPLWGELVPPRPPAPGTPPPPEEAGRSAPGDARRRMARRREADQTRRRDPLLLNRFETILGLAEMVNLARAVEDDDEEGARQAADDLDEIALARHHRRAATRLKMELDLPPDAVAAAPLAPSSHLYPEWDHLRGAYHRDHCRVIAEPAAEQGEAWVPDAAARRRIRRVRRQFEALRPRRQILHAQPDGEELDLSAVVRALADRRAGAPGSDRLYSTARANQRDLSVAVLVDVSLSTDAWMDDRRVLDVEKEALLALAAGLDACGDEHAILTFTSRRREAVWVRTVKDFDEAFGAAVAARIRALRPGHYTRMGAAIRHTAKALAQRPHGHRLLLLLTDGKPNDTDHYEGRYAVEDTRMAIREARRSGLKVFGITVDREARGYIPYLFGPGAYVMFGDIARLPAALPAIWRQIVQ